MAQELNQVVEDFKIQYGEGIMVHNTHNLLHLAKEIEFWGPLWTFWSFPFESFLGTIKKMPFGTKNPELVISKTIVRNQELPIVLRNLSNIQVKSVSIIFSHTIFLYTIFYFFLFLDQAVARKGNKKCN